MPGTELTIWFVSPWHMKPAPRIATRTGLPCFARAFSALSTMIMSSSNRHAALDLGLDLREQLPYLVLLGDHRHGQRPGQVESRIVVAQTPLGAGGVELADLVAGLGGVPEDLVPVGEPLRDVERPAVVLVQLDRDVLEVGGALGPEVDDDVEDRPARAADELRLGGGRELEVHPAQRPLLLVEGDVGLRD